MQIVAQQKNVRQAPRKVRLVANQVKKMDLQMAVAQLGALERRSSVVLLKVIRQAVGNAQKNHQLDVEDLALSDIIVEDGAILRRMRPVSRGRGHGIDKRTCHIKVVLDTKEKKQESRAASAEQTTTDSKEK